MKISPDRRLLLTLALAASAVGCGSSGSSPTPSAGASVAASTSSHNTPSPVTSATTGPVTTGSPAAVSSSATTVLSKNGPAITLTSPARGEFETQPVVNVAGTVSDPTGVTMLTIQGNPVAPASNGAFSEVIPLTPGLDIIDVEATNGAGLSSKVSLSVVCGPFLDASQPIQNAFAVRLDAEALTAIGNAAAAQLGGAALAQDILAKNPLYSGTWAPLGFTIASAQVNATSASFGNPTLALTPLQGALAVHAVIPAIDVVANAQSIGGIPYSITGDVTADSATVDAQIALSVVNGTLTSTVTSSQVSLQNFNWGLNGFPSFLTGLASSWVQGLIQNAVNKQVDAVVPQELNKALAGLASGFTETFLGSTASFSVAPNWVQQDTLGMSLDADANVTMTPVPGYQPLAAPGSFYTGGPVPTNGGPSPGFFASVNQDVMNRFAFAAWQSGILEIKVNNQPTSTIPIPAGVALDGTFLQTWIPQLKGLFPGTDPVEIDISPKLPPIFVVEPAPETLEADLGELELSVYDIAPGQPQVLIVTIAVHAKVTTSASVTSGVVTLGLNPTVQIDASLVASPLSPNLDANAVSNFIEFSVPPLLQSAANTWSGYALPVYPGLSPQNVLIGADGAQQTFLTAQGDL
jgi:hypothetical protein